MKLRIFYKITHLFYLLAVLIVAQGCFAFGTKKTLTLETQIKKRETLNTSLSSVDVSNNVFTITGAGLSEVAEIKLKGSGVDTKLSVISQTSSKIIASGSESLSVLMGSAFELILSNAVAQSSYTINFTLNDGSLAASKISGAGAQNGYVLKYNGSSWVPAPGSRAGSRTPTAPSPGGT